MRKQIRTEIVISASEEKVWNIRSNICKYSFCNPFLLQAEGTLATGNRLINTMHNGDKTFVFKPKILNVLPYTYFDGQGKLFSKGICEGDRYFEIEELTLTQVKFNLGEHFSGILRSFLLTKIGNETRNSFIKTNGAIKQLAEAINH